MVVYVIGFAPAYTVDGEARAAIGGFKWYYSLHNARHALVEEAKYADDDHSLTFVPLDVPADAIEAIEEIGSQRKSESITRWIEENLHLIEVGITSLRA